MGIGRGYGQQEALGRIDHLRNNYAVTSGRVLRMAAAFDEGTGGDYRPIFSITFYRLYPGYGDITAMENRPRR